MLVIICLDLILIRWPAYPCTTAALKDAAASEKSPLFEKEGVETSLIH